MKEKKHFLRPLKGRRRKGRHLLVWIAADESATRLVCTGCRCWDVLWDGDHVDATPMDGWRLGESIDSILHAATHERGELIVWLARGWEDLVLSGIAALIDGGMVTFRYANMDGQKLLIRGLYRGKSVTITSMANWLGRHWRDWKSAVDDAQCQRLLTAFDGRVADGGAPLAGDERSFAAAWCAIAATSNITDCGSVEPTVASAARKIWRRWLGPRLEVSASGRGKCRRKPASECVEIVAPSPYRPEKAALAERHVCYGLQFRQYRIGFVDEPIYCLDMRGAYALALATALLPAYYWRSLHRPSLESLGEHLQASTGYALVRVRQEELCFPVRRRRRTFPAYGHYWTWLAGTELAGAITTKSIAEVQKAHLWRAITIRPEAAEALLRFGEGCEAARCPAVGSAWRSLYSALVGQFAGRRRVWKDVPYRPNFERWCQWRRVHCVTGVYETCRSIAGRHQVLAELGDTSASVPLFYACITAHVRWAMRILAAKSGMENVIAEVADSLWVNSAGYQALMRESSLEGFPPDALRCKDVYDRAWMSGAAECVVERHGERFLRAPGCPDGACLDTSGAYRSSAAMPWHHTGPIPEKRGIRRHRRSYSGRLLMERCGHPAQQLMPGERLDEPLLAAELLEPPIYDRRVDDE